MLTVAQLTFAVTNWLTERHQHHVSGAGIAAVAVFLVAVWGGLLLAVLSRRRWAWIVLAVLLASSLITWAWKSGSTEGLIYSIPALVLLLSPPMRRYVGA